MNGNTFIMGRIEQLTSETSGVQIMPSGFTLHPDELPEDVRKSLYRIFSLTVIKDDPDEDAYDALYKIGRVAREILLKYDSNFRETAERVNDATGNAASKGGG